MKDIHDILRTAAERSGQSFALATLVRAEGSSYRRPGARMLVCADGCAVGSLSGGCLEEEVALHAQDVLATGRPRTVPFDTRRRFGCNGKIDIFIERVDYALLAELSSHVQARHSCSIATVYADPSGEGPALSGAKWAARSPLDELAVATFASSALGTRILSSSVRESLALTKAEWAAISSSPKVHILTQELHPPIRLLIVGDGPDSVPLRTSAALLGWLPLELSGMESLPNDLDPWTAAVVKSHNYGRDFSALRKLLPLNLPYLGLVGPRKRRDQLLHDLLEVGISINAGFFAPAGLDLGAESPEEIALSIISEIQRVFSSGTGESLRERKTPIHLSRASTSCAPAAECEKSAL